MFPAAEKELKCLKKIDRDEDNILAWVILDERCRQQNMGDLNERLKRDRTEKNKGNEKEKGK